MFTVLLLQISIIFFNPLAFSFIVVLVVYFVVLVGVLFTLEDAYS